MDYNKLKVSNVSSSSSVSYLDFLLLNFSNTRQNTYILNYLLNFVFVLFFKGINLFLLNNRDHMEIINSLKILQSEFFHRSFMNGTWSMRKNEQKRLYALYKDILYSFVLYLNNFTCNYLDRKLMGLVAQTNRKLKHLKILSVCIFCIAISVLILTRLSASAVGINYFISIYVMCLTVIFIIFISIATYFILMLESINTEERIFMLKTFSFGILMTKSLILSLNGIYAVFFESFSLTRMAIALYEAWLAFDFARKIKNENEQRKVSFTMVKSLLPFNIHTFAQMRARKNFLYSYNEDYWTRSQIEFEEAQNEK